MRKQFKFAEDLKNPLNKISKDTLIYVPAFLIPAFINVFSLVIFTRIFSPGAYGEYSLVVTTTTFVTILISEWITQSIQRYLPQYKDSDEKSFFFSYLRMLVFTVFMAVIFAALLLYPFLSPYLHRFEVYYWPATILILLQFLFAVSGVIFQSELRSKEFSIFRIMNVLFRLIFSLAWIYLIAEDVIGLIWGAVFAFLVLIAPMLRKNGIFKKSEFEFPKQHHSFSRYFTQFITYGFPMMGWFIGTSILDISDRYLLNILGSSEDVGIYAANYNLISASLGLVTAPILTAAQPVIMNMVNKVFEDLDEINTIISNLSRIYLLVVIPFTVYVAVFRYEITHLLLGEQFREGAIIIPILLIAFSLWNFSMYGQIGHMIKEKTHIMLLYVLIAAVTNILLNLLFIPLYGYTGAALSTLISFLVYPVFIYYSSRKYVPWKIRWGSFLRISLVSLLIGVIISLYRSWIPVSFPTLANLLIGFGITLPLYFVMLFLTKEVGKKEISALKGFLSSFKSNKKGIS